MFLATCLYQIAVFCCGAICFNLTLSGMPEPVLTIAKGLMKLGSFVVMAVSANILAKMWGLI